jgi:TRAP-type uncharacterized transport system fused permease subunit
LFSGSWVDITRAVVTGTIGVITLAAALEGYFIRTTSWWERGLFAVAALLLIDPGLYTDLLGLALLAIGLGWQRMRPAIAVADARSLS